MYVENDRLLDDVNAKAVFFPLAINSCVCDIRQVLSSSRRQPGPSVWAFDSNKGQTAFVTQRYLM